MGEGRASNTTVRWSTWTRQPAAARPLRQAAPMSRPSTIANRTTYPPASMSGPPSRPGRRGGDSAAFRPAYGQIPSARTTGLDRSTPSLLHPRRRRRRRSAPGCRVRTAPVCQKRHVFQKRQPASTASCTSSRRPTATVPERQVVAGDLPPHVPGGIDHGHAPGAPIDRSTIARSWVRACTRSADPCSTGTPRPPRARACHPGRRWRPSR